MIEESNVMYRDNVWAAANRLAERVAPAYIMLDWKWADGEIPTTRHIRGELLRLYDDCRDPDVGRSECGGLYCDVDDEGVVTFGFEVTEIVPEEE